MHTNRSDCEAGAHNAIVAAAMHLAQQLIRIRQSALRLLRGRSQHFSWSKALAPRQVTRFGSPRWLRASPKAYNTRKLEAA